MSTINFSVIYGEDKQIPTATTGGSSYKPMVPPTNKLDDDTIEITDFVKGVTIKSWEYDEVKDQAVITFEDNTGGTIRKYLGNPVNDKRIVNQQDETKKANQLKYAYKEFSNVVKQYVYSNTVDKKIADAGDMDFKQYVTLLGDILASGENRTKQEVWLKLLFQSPSAVEPKYTVGRDTWIGNEGFQPRWKKNGDQYDDVTNFSYQEKLPDMDNGADDISSIFSTSIPAIL